LSGGAEHTTAISDKAEKAAREMKDGPAQRAANLAAIMRMDPSLEENGKYAETVAAKKGTSAELSGALGEKYKPDKAGEVTSDNSWWGKLWRKEARSYGHMDNNQNFVDATNAINSADPDQMKDFKTLDKDGALSDSIRQQIEALKVLKSKGADTIIAADDSTTNTGTDIKAYEAALARLTDTVATAGATQSGIVPEMTVTNMIVTNMKEK
jgi:hypothetical protein